MPALSTLEALDPSSTKFMDTDLLKRFSALYGELDIDDILLESQAGIAKPFLLDEEKKPENFLDIASSGITSALLRSYKVLCIVATFPVTTASNERLFSRLKIVKNYLRYTTGDGCLSHLLLMFAEKDLVKNLTTTSLLTRKISAEGKPRFLLQVSAC